MDDSINTNYDPINTITLIVEKTLSQFSKKYKRNRNNVPKRERSIFSAL